MICMGPVAAVICMGGMLLLRGVAAVICMGGWGSVAVIRMGEDGSDSMGGWQ